MAAHADRQALCFREDYLVLAIRIGRPPRYKDDCLPDPPAFSNPFAWDGKSARAQVQAKPIEKPDPQALEDCLKQLPQDSIEAESARDRRLMEWWDLNRLGR
jgi:hypothetical protein